MLRILFCDSSNAATGPITKNSESPKTARWRLVVSPIDRDCVSGFADDIHVFRRRTKHDESFANRSSFAKRPSICALSKPSLVPDAAAIGAGHHSSELTVNAHDAHPNELADKLAAEAIDRVLWPAFTNHVQPVVTQSPAQR